MRQLVGKTLAGKFRITEHIADGAMGSVFRARHLELDTDVCIKILQPHLAQNPTAERRFRREARAAAKLKHPNCISILDFGATEDGTLYLDIVESDEGSHDGILESYVRWLHFRFFSEQSA